MDEFEAKKKRFFESAFENGKVEDEDDFNENEIHLLQLPKEVSKFMKQKLGKLPDYKMKHT